MSRYDPYSKRTSRTSHKTVTFQDDLPRYRATTGPAAASSSSNPYPQPPSSTSFTPYTPQPGPTRHGSMPTRLRSRELRVAGLEALNGMRAYLKEACNFHGEHLRRALSVPSVKALSALISFVNVLRKIDSRVTKRDENVLNALIDFNKRHPHELLAEDDRLDWMPSHEANAHRAHKKRLRRESEHHLLVFVSRQLRLPMSLLRELSSQQRTQRELDAFKDRITKFNTPGTGAARDDVFGGGTNSAPQSPAHRVPTAARSPRSVPVDDVRRAYDLPGQSMEELFTEMGELHLPGSSFDTGGPSAVGSTAGQTPTARRKAAASMPSYHSRAPPHAALPLSSASIAALTAQEQPYASPYIGPQAAPFMYESTAATAAATTATAVQAQRSAAMVGPGNATAAAPLYSPYTGTTTMGLEASAPPASPYVGPTSYGTAAAPVAAGPGVGNTVAGSAPVAGPAHVSMATFGMANAPPAPTAHGQPISYPGTPPPAPAGGGAIGRKPPAVGPSGYEPRGERR